MAIDNYSCKRLSLLHMDKLPEIKQRKLIDKKAFIKLAEKVRKTLEMERDYLIKTKNDRDNSSTQSYFCS